MSVPLPVAIPLLSSETIQATGRTFLQVGGSRVIGGIGIIAIVVVLQLLALVSAIRGRLRLIPKVLWILAIVFAPLIGAVSYFLLGRTRR